MAKQGLLDSVAPKPNNSDDHPGGLKVITNRDWRDGDDPSLVLWLHTGDADSDAVLPFRRAVNYFPAFVKSTDADGNETEYLRPGNRFLAADTIETIIGQKRLMKAIHQYKFWYRKDFNDPASPCKYPAVSPFFVLQHLLIEEINAGRLDRDEVIFEWTYTNKDDKKMTIKMVAGKMVGMDDRTDGDAWKHRIGPRMESIIPCVDNDSPDDGLCVLITTGMLAGSNDQDSRVPREDFYGGKIGAEIQSMRIQLDKKNEQLAKKGKPTKSVNEIDPYLNPYPFMLTYDASADNPGNKYAITNLMSDMADGAYELDEAIQAGIETECDMEQLSRYTTPKRSDFETLKESMTRGNEGLKYQLPIDEIFAPWALVLGEDEKSDGQETDGSDGSDGSEAENLFCTCGLHLDASWRVCPNCGEDLNGDAEPPDLDELAYNGALQKCKCGQVSSIDAGTCPECNAELPIQVGEADGYDDYTDE